MLPNIEYKQIVELAQKYEMDVEQVVDLLEEGFTLEEAEEIIEAAEY